MATWLLIHSPLVGPGTWSRVAALLRRSGEEAVIPDLTPTLAAEGCHAVLQAELVAGPVKGGAVVLVAHSAAGPLLPLIAQRLNWQGVTVTASVFVDAGLPHPGRSAMDVLPTPAVEQLRLMAVDGWLPPWTSWWSPEQLQAMLPDAQLRKLMIESSPRVPVSLLMEALPAVEEDNLGTCSYIRLSAPYESLAQKAEQAGWRVGRIDANHLAILTSPGEVFEAMRELGTGAAPAVPAGDTGLMSPRVV